MSEIELEGYTHFTRVENMMSITVKPIFLAKIDDTEKHESLDNVAQYCYCVRV